MRRKGERNLETRVVQIMKLAYQVNQKTKHTTFFEFAGHVNLLRVEICTGGYVEGKSIRWERQVWMNTEEHTFKMLSEIRAKLKSLLAEGGTK